MFGDGSASATAHVLLVAGDSAWRAHVVDALRQAWCVVAVVSDGVELRDGGVPRADLAVVDLGLRAPSGVEVCATLRAESAILILAVGPDAPEDDVIDALSAGADGFVPMSASPRVLLARVRGLLRRAPAAPPLSPEVLVRGSIELSRSGTVSVMGQPLDLRPAELEILSLLLLHAGRVVARSELLAHLSSVDLVDGDLDHHLRRLRDQLEAGESGCSIRTIRKVGVRLDEVTPLPVAPPDAAWSDGPRLRSAGWARHT